MSFYPQGPKIPRELPNCTCSGWHLQALFYHLWWHPSESRQRRSSTPSTHPTHRCPPVKPKTSSWKRRDLERFHDLTCNKSLQARLLKRRAMANTCRMRRFEKCCCGTKPERIQIIENLKQCFWWLSKYWWTGQHEIFESLSWNFQSTCKR